MRLPVPSAQAVAAAGAGDLLSKLLMLPWGSPAAAIYPEKAVATAGAVSPERASMAVGLAPA